MADIKVWNWNNFKGGLSDNAYIGQTGSFQNGSRNIDTESEPGGVKLAPSASDFVTTTGAQSFILNGSLYGVTGIYTFNTDKSIYLDTTLKAAYNSTPATTMGIIYHATIMYVGGTPFLYLFSSTGIHKATTDLSSFTYNVASIESSTYKSSFLYAGDIYFTSGNKLYRYTTSEVLTNIFTGATEDSFRAMTFFQDSVHIYSNINDTNGRQYIMTIGANVADYVTEWNGLPIMGAANMGGIDYVITGASSTYSDLYTVSGTTRQQIKGNIEGIKGRTFNGLIISRRDDMFIGGATFNNSNGALFKYGRFFPGIPDALTCPYGADTTTITAIAFNGPYIYIGTTSSGVHKVKRIETSNPPYATSYYATSGELISMVFDGGSPTTEKILHRIKIAYDCDNNSVIPKGGSFELYARLKNSQSWTKIGNTYTKTDVGVIDIIENEIMDAGFDKFTQLEYKLLSLPSTSGGNNYYTPFIRAIQTFYYDNINV